MLAAITAAILYLAGSLPQLQHAPGGPQFRASSYAHLIDSAAERNDVDPLLLVALIKHESAFDAAARSQEGAYGLTQLNPRYWGRGVVWRCETHPETCVELQIERGAQALHHYIETCGGEARGLTAYRTGHCMAVGPRAREVLRTRALLRQKFGSQVQLGKAVLL